jgi:hypothetical protein
MHISTPILGQSMSVSWLIPQPFYDEVVRIGITAPEMGSVRLE